MGRIKEIIEDYELRNVTEFDSEDPAMVHKVENLVFKTFLEKRIKEQPESMNPEILEFLEAVLKEHPDCCFWVMVSDNTDTANISFDSIYEMAQAVSTLASMKYNVYYSPAVFSGWREDVNVQYVNSIFIDIDDVDDTDFSSMATEQIKEWLIHTYYLSEEMLPNICVASGHGLHLYYLVDELYMKDMEQREKRDKYTDYLITYFFADVACRNKSRVLRIPHSYNVKHEEVQTALHWFDACGNKDISRLDYFFASEGEIKTHMRHSQEAKNEKARATKERNKAEKEASSETACEREKVGVTPQKSNKKKIAEEESGQMVLPREAGMIYYTSFNPRNRYWNIIKDLHNFYVRHNGELYRRRNIFVTILSSYLKRVMSLEGALEFVGKYLTEDFEEEGIKTVTGIYEREKTYRYRNLTIAEQLGFTQQDIDQSYCNFSEERIEQARIKAMQESNKTLAQRRKAARNVADCKKVMYEDIKISPLTVKELAYVWGVSESTIKRIRRKIREEE